MLSRFCAVALLVSVPASAASDVHLSATLVNSCTLTVGTTGVMTASPDGTRIGSEENGGTAATLSLTAIGALPTVNFAAPSLSNSPAGWSASPTVAIRYTSSGGANQAYTSSSSSASANSLNDSFTIHGRVTSNSGFAAGTYNLRTVVTCSQ